MELILIACSGKKISGGSTDYKRSSLEGCLSKETYQNLLCSRQELAKIMDYSPAPDFGNDSNNHRIQFLPAYCRYSGIVYQQGRVKELFPTIKEKRIIIVSALYGILEVSDSIRNYDLKMDETLPTGVRLYTWWHHQNLSEILEECIKSVKPSLVHDLLSNVYRSSIAPWPPASFEIEGIGYKDYEYPGLGTGSLWHRGNDLKSLLLDDRDIAICLDH